MLNENADFVMWNKNMCLYAEASEKEMSSLNAFSLFHEDKELITNKISEVFETGTASIEAKLVSLTGKITSFLFSARKITIDDKVYLLGSGIDISDRRLAELQLKESENKLRTIFDTLTEGIALNKIIYNEFGEMIDYQIIEVNNCFYSTADVNTDKVIGNFATEIYKMKREDILQFWNVH